MAERRDVYPVGKNMVTYWEPTGTMGKIDIEIAGHTPGILLEWEEYRFPEDIYSARYYGANYLGVFSRRGRRFMVTETYKNTSITNSGRKVRNFRYQSRDGICCTELVRAVQAGDRLVLRLEEGKRVIHVKQYQDHTYHEIDIEKFHDSGVFDLRRYTATLNRSRWRDGST